MPKKIAFIILTALLGQICKSAPADTFEERLKRASASGRIVFLTSDDKEFNPIALSPTVGSNFIDKKALLLITAATGAMLIGLSIGIDNPKKNTLGVLGVATFALSSLLGIKHEVDERQKNAEAIGVINEQLLKFQYFKWKDEQKNKKSL